MPWSLLLLVVGAGVAAAQDLPIHSPVSPVVVSRSALYGQPLMAPTGGWQVRTMVDYSSVVDFSATRTRELVLDAELLTADLWVIRDLSPTRFVLANIAIRGAYDGHFDETINTFHRLTGLRVPARDRLPINRYDWHAELPDTFVVRDRPGTFVGDLRLGAGWRIGRSQVVASLTLPTATAGVPGWSRGSIGTAVAVTSSLFEHGRWQIQGGLSAGWTPATGELARYQRENFLAAMSGVRLRVGERQALYSTVWFHQGPWRDTGLKTMDHPDFTIDFGALLRPWQGSPEFQISMTEDLYPNGPAIDVGLRLGIRW